VAAHFVTLFDSGFLAAGLCLHASLVKHAAPFRLWILCMDDLVHEQLTLLALPYVTLVPLRDVETDALRGIRAGRTPVEYFWTLTPFTPQVVFDRDPAVQQVTYLDADLYFLASPRILLDELAAAGKSVLITDHAYAPEYDQTSTAGRFCVQFLTVRRTAGGLKVLRWWQDRCVEWCFDRVEDGKFGDQKYLDDWPKRFGEHVHVVRQVEKTLAPWNVRHVEQRGKLAPVFYHFHSLRILSRHKARLYGGYRVGPGGLALYRHYVQQLAASLRLIESRHLEVKYLPARPSSGWLRSLKSRLTGRGDVFARLG